MEVSTVLWICSGIGVISLLICFLVDEDIVLPFLVIGMLLLVGGILGQLLNSSYQSDKAREICIQNAVYNRGTQARVKGMTSPMVVIGVRCVDSSTQERQYEIVSPDTGVILEVKETDLEK